MIAQGGGASSSAEGDGAARRRTSLGLLGGLFEDADVVDVHLDGKGVELDVAEPGPELAHELVFPSPPRFGRMSANDGS